MISPWKPFLRGRICTLKNTNLKCWKCIKTSRRQKWPRSGSYTWEKVKYSIPGRLSSMKLRNFWWRVCWNWQWRWTTANLWIAPVLTKLQGFSMEIRNPLLSVLSQIIRNYSLSKKVKWKYSWTEAASTTKVRNKSQPSKRISASTISTCLHNRRSSSIRRFSFTKSE